MQFTQIIGQKDLKTQLNQMILQNRLSHALLFLGKEGTGSLPLALAFAQYITCEKNPLQKQKKQAVPVAEVSLFGDEPAFEAPIENSTEEFIDACGICSACKKATLMVHPDIHYAYPVIPRKPGDKPVSTDYIVEWREFVQKTPYANAFDWLQFIKAENKQGNITSEECNNIIHKMSLKSFESSFKILIMWMPEALGKNGNKLLKLLEEPPPDTLFILVAENYELILPTILSRTQLVKVPLLTSADIATALQHSESVPEGKAQQIASISQGNYHEALQHLQNADDDWETMLREWLNSILKNGPASQVKWIEDAAKLGREKQKQFLKYFTHILEQSIRLGASANEAAIDPANVDFAIRFNKLCSIPQQEAIATELDKASYYIERNANAKMLFHALTIRLFHIIRNKSLILIQ
jgi:DNA polymerase III subunit delta'